MEDSSQHERRALIERGVMRVVPTPPAGVRDTYSAGITIRTVVSSSVRLAYWPWAMVRHVVKSITVRLLLALAFIFNMHIHQLDVSNVFCYADIEGDAYMQPIPDFELPLGYCFKLQKS